MKSLPLPTDSYRSLTQAPELLSLPTKHNIVPIVLARFYSPKRKGWQSLLLSLSRQIPPSPDPGRNQQKIILPICITIIKNHNFLAFINE